MVSYSVVLLGCIAGVQSWGCNGGDDCCSLFNQCDREEGDCDLDTDCRGFLTCGTDNCNGSTFEDDDDCCEGCNGGDECCTWLNQCWQGEGDCDEDIDCKGSLKCGTDNCNGSTFEDDDDCCEPATTTTTKPPTTTTKPAPTTEKSACTCNGYVHPQTGYGNCERNFEGRPICYVNEPSSCSDYRPSRQPSRRAQGYSWKACEQGKTAKPGSGVDDSRVIFPTM